MENRINKHEQKEDFSNLSAADREIRNSYGFAKETYKETGKFVPMVIGLTSEGRFVVPFIGWDNNNDKYTVADAIKKAFRLKGVTAIVFMTEAYGVKLRHPSLFNENIVPSEHADREDVFIINYIDKEGTKGIMAPVSYADGKATLGEIEYESTKKGFTVVDHLWSSYFKEEER